MDRFCPNCSQRLDGDVEAHPLSVCVKNLQREITTLESSLNRKFERLEGTVTAQAQALYKISDLIAGFTEFLHKWRQQ